MAKRHGKAGSIVAKTAGSSNEVGLAPIVFSTIENSPTRPAFKAVRRLAPRSVAPTFLQAVYSYETPMPVIARDDAVRPRPAGFLGIQMPVRRKVTAPTPVEVHGPQDKGQIAETHRN